MSPLADTPTIRFHATPYAIGERTVLLLPEKASEKLPSRGQVAVEGTINDHPFQTVLEPDGQSGHWMAIPRQLQQDAGLALGNPVALQMKPRKEWPEPHVPKDLQSALGAAPQKTRDLWKDITPMARWEWVRWINATKNPDTRNRRIDVTISKMSSGNRRPCCFNLASCTDPELSKNGRLVEPT